MKTYYSTITIETPQTAAPVQSWKKYGVAAAAISLVVVASVVGMSTVGVAVNGAVDAANALPKVDPATQSACTAAYAFCQPGSDKDACFQGATADDCVACLTSQAPSGITMDAGTWGGKCWDAVSACAGGLVCPQHSRTHAGDFCMHCINDKTNGDDPSDMI
jgi:hypothetical protein